MNAQRTSQRFAAARSLIQRQGRELEHSLATLAASLRHAHAGQQARNLLRAQWALMHLTLARVVDNARESLAILAATRTELVHLMKKTAKSSAKKSSPKKPATKKKTVKAKAKGGKLSALKAKVKKVTKTLKSKAGKAKKSAGKAKASAKKSVSKGKASAKKAVSKAKASAKKTVRKATSKAKAATRKPVARIKAATQKPVAKVKAVTRKPVAKAKAVVKQTTDAARQTGSAFAARVESAAAPMMSAAQNITPNPFSRAFLATSKGKKDGEMPSLGSNDMPTPGSSGSGNG